MYSTMLGSWLHKMQLLVARKCSEYTMYVVFVEQAVDCV